MNVDVTSGYGSLANIMANEFMRDEAPKAPILLFAIENQNKFNQKEQYSKYDLFELNKALWLGELAPSVDMVVPFDADYMSSKIADEILLNYKPKELLYHRSAI